MDCDFLIVGAGIAGASAAYELASRTRGDASIVLLEREDSPGYHSTGRSAALYADSYTHGAFLHLALASRRFLDDPPAGFTDTPLLSPRGLLYVARQDQRAKAEEIFAEYADMVPGLRLIEGAEAVAMHGVLTTGQVACAVHEPGAMDIDVHALHQGFLGGFKAAGGILATSSEVRGLERKAGRWRVTAGETAYNASTVVNAAGAWADDLAGLAGLGPLGLVPKRRTAINIDPPQGIDHAGWPMVCDVDETLYFKPDAGQLMASPLDETPSAPCDAQPEELDVAIAVERIEKATTLKVERIVHKWAGLRSFFDDGEPAVGFDPRAEGLFWLAGQGGYGIMTSPAMGRLAAALATDAPVPGDLAERGITEADVSPARLLG